VVDERVDSGAKGFCSAGTSEGGECRVSQGDPGTYGSSVAKVAP